jgi:hypothetical protein
MCFHVFQGKYFTFLKEYWIGQILRKLEPAVSSDKEKFVFVFSSC